MNLQESIRRILREEKDHKKLIKTIIDSSDIYDYKYFCGVDIITPEERSDQHNYLNKDRIPYLIKVYYVGGPNSEVWPRTQAIHYKELDLMEQLHEYIKSLVPFNIEMWRAYVNTCDGYERLMKRKYTTDDLQESIRRILREETSFMDKMRNLFTKDKPTSDDKLIDLIVDYIRLSFDIIETEFRGEYLYTLNGNLVMSYTKKYKSLYYRWDFAKDIYNYIPDNRLLHLDSEMMGKIFTKLFNRPVKEVYGYSMIG